MEIRRTDGVGGPGGTGRIEGSRPTPPPAPAGGPARPHGADRVEISNVARFLGAANNLPPVRQEKIDRLKEEIAKGGYETPDRIEKAVERLLDELGDADEA
jgi:negative regulator of flagellin synthesis FlgM